MMRIAKGLLLAGAVLLGACGSETKNVTNVTDCQPSRWNAAAPTAPPCTVALNFRVTDTNAVFSDGQLEWKGSMQYDPITRIAYQDSSWTGPYPKLYDDGAWDDATPANRGHEPSGEVKGDGIFGVAIFVYPPATDSQTWEYGLNDSTYSNGWLWPPGPNGSIAVDATSTGHIDAPDFALPAFGTIDVKLTIDVAGLAGGFDYAGLANKTPVQVKGTITSWSDVVIYDDGTHGDDTAADGIYTLVLSQFVGAGSPLPHSGLAKSGDTVEFVFAFGPGHLGDATYTEYKVSSVPPTTGVAAYTGAPASWTARTVGNLSTNSNTYITVP